MNLGIESLIPTAAVLILAVISRRTVEPLLGGVVVGLVLLAPENLMSNLTGTMLSVMADETIGWVILVCGLMGSFIHLLVKIGGAVAFGNLVAKHIKTGASALLVSWLLGLVIFIDDYLNTLTISSSMKKVTDKFGVSREMLAYVVDSTAAPICVLIPLSTWVVYFSAVLEKSLDVESGQGLALYMDALPYMFYPWVAVVLVPLVILKKVPLLGGMKKAELAAKSALSSSAAHAVENHQDQSNQNNEHPEDISNSASRALRFVGLNFFIPILSLIFFTWYFDIDILKGVVIALVITVFLSSIQRMIRLVEIFDGMLEGFKSMLLPLAVVVASFMLKNVNDQLGLTTYVIEHVTPLMTPVLLPVVTFITMALLAFATGSFWGIFAVATPIVMPLAASVGADYSLVIGALISASVFGSHACFYGDSTVLSAHGSGCSVMSHALTQLPYVLIAALISSITYVLVAL